MDDRRKALEAFLSDLKAGMPQMDDHIDLQQNPWDKALDARNLAQDALALEVQKNTGLSVPNANAPRSKVEDYLNRQMKERYPEMEPNVQLKDLSKEGARGTYHKGAVELDQDLYKRDPIGALGTTLHESAHQYDDKVLNNIGTDLKLAELRKMKDKGLLQKADAGDLYEAIAKGHHTEIPNLREGSFGLGALKSMIKSGTFKGVAPLLAGGAGLLASGVSEAADTEEMGGGSEQNALLREIDEKNRRKQALSGMSPVQGNALNKVYEGIDNGTNLGSAADFIDPNKLKMDALRKLTEK